MSFKSTASAQRNTTLRELLKPHAVLSQNQGVFGNDQTDRMIKQIVYRGGKGPKILN